jgi:hypothetical protein
VLEVGMRDLGFMANVRDFVSGDPSDQTIPDLEWAFNLGFPNLLCVVSLPV